MRMTISAGSDAPTTAATIANVVMIPSNPPNTSDLIMSPASLLKTDETETYIFRIVFSSVFAREKRILRHAMHYPAWFSWLATCASLLSSVLFAKKAARANCKSLVAMALFFEREKRSLTSPADRNCTVTLLSQRKRK